MDEAAFLHVVDVIRARFFTLTDFVTQGTGLLRGRLRDRTRKRWSNLNAPGARELLRELGERLAATPEFTEQSVEAELRKLAAERGVKAGRDHQRLARGSDRTSGGAERVRGVCCAWAASARSRGCKELR